MSAPEVGDGTRPVRLDAANLKPQVSMEVRIEGRDDKMAETVTEVRLVVDDPDAFTISSAMAVFCTIAETEPPLLLSSPWTAGRREDDL